jgi:mono/diheme cytochrome c family protein
MLKERKRLMQRESLLAAVLLPSVLLLAANAANSKASAAPATGQSTAVKAASGCRGCHGMSTWRVLPDSHANYTKGDAQCLGCHNRNDGHYTARAVRYIPHVLGDQLAKTSGSESMAKADGALLYADNCSNCHGDKASTTIKTKSVVAVKAAMVSADNGMNTPAIKELTTDQLDSVISYLSKK